MMKTTKAKASRVSTLKRADLFRDSIVFDVASYPALKALG